MLFIWLSIHKSFTPFHFKCSSNHISHYGKKKKGKKSPWCELTRVIKNKRKISSFLLNLHLLVGLRGTTTDNNQPSDRLFSRQDMTISRTTFFHVSIHSIGNQIDPYLFIARYYLNSNRLEEKKRSKFIIRVSISNNGSAIPKSC